MEFVSDGGSIREVSCSIHLLCQYIVTIGLCSEILSSPLLLSSLVPPFPCFLRVVACLVVPRLSFPLSQLPVPWSAVASHSSSTVRTGHLVRGAATGRRHDPPGRSSPVTAGHQPASGTPPQDSCPVQTERDQVRNEK